MRAARRACWSASRAPRSTTFTRGPGLSGVVPSPLVSWSGRIDSPYRGLGAFDQRDAGFFFGRDVAAARVLERMSGCLPGGGPLVISGVSGAGKSSLLRAGVLPVRGAGLAAAAEASSWPCVILTPTREPLAELAVRVAPLAGADAATIRQALAADPAGFVLTARQAARAGGAASPSTGRPPGARQRAGPAAAPPDRRPVRAGVKPCERESAGVHRGPARGRHRRARRGAVARGVRGAGGARRFRGPAGRLPAADHGGAGQVPADLDDRAAAAAGHRRAGRGDGVEGRRRPGGGAAEGGRCPGAGPAARRLRGRRGAAAAVARPGPGLARPRGDDPDPGRL